MPTPKHGLDLEAIEARANAATEGPWAAVLLSDVSDTSYVSMQDAEDGSSLDIGSCGIFPDGVQSIEKNQNQIHANILFCAHARQDIPNLIAEVRRLRELADAAMKHVEARETNRLLNSTVSRTKALETYWKLAAAVSRHVEERGK